MWEPLKFDIGLNYKYVKNNIFFKLISNLFYYIIVAPIIFLISKIIFGLRIEGKENLKNIKSGALSVSNHVQYIDCAMLGLAWFPRRIYYTAKTDGFKMPVVRHLVRLLYAIPIPEKISCKENFYKAIDDLLAKNKVVHFYPEASLWPYYNKLRNFATVIPLSLRELVFYSTNLSLPIFLFTREVVVLYFIIYQDIIIHGKPCLLNICPYFAISLFCIGEELSLP